MSRAVLKPRTAAELLLGAIAVVLIVTVIFLMIYGVSQPSANPSPATNPREVIHNTEKNVILGMAILGILGTFGIIAYYYTTISLR